MFKKNIVLLIIITIVLSSCSKNNNNIENLGVDRVDRNLKGLTLSENTDFSTDIRNVTDWTKIINYDGTPITLDFAISNIKDKAEYGVIIFVDGVRVSFSTNEHSQLSYMQIFNLEAQEENREISVTLSPDFIPQGETVAINIATILNPVYTPNSIDLPTSLLHHNLLPLSPYFIEVNTPQKRKILFSNDINSEENVSNELEKEFTYEVPVEQDDTLIETVNELDNKTYFRLFQNTMETLEIIEPYYSINKGEELQLKLACFGNSGSYRVSLYINNEIVPAFNGKDYLDINVEREKIKISNITLSVSELEKYDEFNHIFFIAVPLEQGEIVTLIKNKTRILHIQPN